MDRVDPKSSVDSLQIGAAIYALIENLCPFCRSKTGDGVRQTMDVLRQLIPLEVHEVASGTKVFDWTVPEEWNIRDAYVKDRSGKRVIDFRESNLHVIGYSAPVHQTMSLEDLRPHLFSLPDRPEWIPYRTSYNDSSWGFCLSHRDYLDLEEGEYEVFIDSTLGDGSLTYGELCLPGDDEAEILISCHTCHPSLCNDNLSGVAIGAFLARYVGGTAHRYSYRFLFIPSTIGAITWLARNEDKVSRIRHGLVLAGLGDPGCLTYKKSRRGDTEIDRAVSHVLRSSGSDHRIVEFEPYGYDERQYCSPGFNLAVGSLSRTPYGTYQEYHTSADNLHFVGPENLGDSFSKIIEVFDVLEMNGAYVNLNPKCEPQLGRRGLYASVREFERAVLWVLNLSDGSHDLLAISERAGLELASIRQAAHWLVEVGLLRPVSTE
jgi:aminopeptidase-like protein